MAPRGKKNQQYTKEHVVKALAEIHDGSLRLFEAAAKYGIPASTLGDKLRGKYSSDKRIKF